MTHTSLQSIASSLIVPAAPSVSAAPAEAPPSRRNFLKRSATMAVAAGSAGILVNAMARPVSAASRASSQQKQYFVQVAKHENDHVAFLVNALGSSARPKPTFQGLAQNSLGAFLAVATVLENVGVGAYLGAAPFINNSDILANAGSILAIEARHAGWFNSVLNLPITGNITGITTDHSFENPLDPGTVANLASPFVASLNGGPDVGYDTTPSDANDIAILNFALALEYLEAEFYNINVPVYGR